MSSSCDVLRKALQQRTQFTSGHRIYVASLAQAGQVDEAREALTRLKKMFPEMTIAWIKEYVPYTAGQCSERNDQNFWS
jgi:hypothetical protein